MLAHAFEQLHVYPKFPFREQFTYKILYTSSKIVDLKNLVLNVKCNSIFNSEKLLCIFERV